MVGRPYRLLARAYQSSLPSPAISTARYNEPLFTRTVACAPALSAPPDSTTRNGFSNASLCFSGDPKIHASANTYSRTKNARCEETTYSYLMTQQPTRQHESASFVLQILFDVRFRLCSFVQFQYVMRSPAQARRAEKGDGGMRWRRRRRNNSRAWGDGGVEPSLADIIHLPF